jgi:serine/threonine protein kinase
MNHKQIVLGEGSYGCVIKPGLDCKGNVNTNKNVITKISILDFYSSNEFQIGKIIIQKYPVEYKRYFSPIFSACPVKFNINNNKNFDINRCQHLIEYVKRDYFYDSYKAFINTKFILLKSNYVVGGKTLIKYIKESKESYSFYYNTLLKATYNIFYSIDLLQKVNIVHNDLYNRNIMYNIKSNKPCIIDFGLSYEIDKMYKKKYNFFDLKYISEFFHSFKDINIHKNNYEYSIYKRFFTFISNNSIYSNFEYNIQNVKTVNNIKKEHINLFIEDVMNGLTLNPDFYFLFNEDEIEIYNSALEQFFYSFINKKMFPNYEAIYKYLLPIIFKYSDEYSAIASISSIFYIIKENDDNFDNNIIVILLTNLFKKAIYPDIKYKINYIQIMNILKFIINNINNHANTFHKDIFMKNFRGMLKANKIDQTWFFDTKYAFIDFNKILSNENINYIKKINIKFG